jgi:hypothetical protein
MRELENRFKLALNWFKSNGFLKTSDKKKKREPNVKPNRTEEAIDDLLVCSSSGIDKENQLFYDDSVPISESFSIETKTENDTNDFLSLENHDKKGVLSVIDNHNLIRSNKSMSFSCLAKKPCSTKRTSSKKRKSMSNKEPIEFIKSQAPKKLLNVHSNKTSSIEKPKAQPACLNKTDNATQKNSKINESKKDEHLTIRLVNDEELIPLADLPKDFWQSLSSHLTSQTRELIEKDFF